MAVRASGRALDRGQCELQAERPALGRFVQPRAGVGVDARAAARAHELDRLRERKAQRRRTDPHASSVGDEIRRVDVQLVPRGDDDAQVRRLVVQQVREDAVHRRGREALGVVDDQHDVQGGLRDLGEPGGGALQLVRGRRAVEQRLREGGPSASHPHRVHEALHEPPRVVGRVRRQPGDDRAAREMLAPPLGEERGLAEARGRLDDDQRAVAELRVAGGEPLADDEVPRRPRRGRLEDQLGGRAARARLCGVRHDSDPGKVAPAGGPSGRPDGAIRHILVTEGVGGGQSAGRPPRAE